MRLVLRDSRREREREREKKVKLNISSEERLGDKVRKFSYRGGWQHSNALVSRSRVLLAGAQQLPEQSITALGARTGVKLAQWTLSLNLLILEADWFLSPSGRYPGDGDLWWRCRLPPGGKAGHSVDFPPGRPGHRPPVLLREVVVVLLLKSLTFSLSSRHWAAAGRSSGSAGAEPGPRPPSPGGRGGRRGLGLHLLLHLLLDLLLVPSEPDLVPGPGPGPGVHLVRPHPQPLAASEGGPGGLGLLGHQAGPADHALAGDWLDGQRGRNSEGRRPQGRPDREGGRGVGGREDPRASWPRLLEGRPWTGLEPQVGLHV